MVSQHVLTQRNQDMLTITNNRCSSCLGIKAFALFAVFFLYGTSAAITAIPVAPTMIVDIIAIRIFLIIWFPALFITFQF